MGTFWLGGQVAITQFSDKHVLCEQKGLGESHLQHTWPDEGERRQRSSVYPKPAYNLTEEQDRWSDAVLDAQLADTGLKIAPVQVLFTRARKQSHESRKVVFACTCVA